MIEQCKITDAVDEFRSHLEKFDWTSHSARRIDILKTFLKLAATEGYSAGTMRSLASAINIKASSIYFHFPDGRDQIVTESMRWHYYNWGNAVLEAIDLTGTADDFWNSLADIHFRLQVLRPESDLWDLLISMDRIAGFLPAATRQETSHWLKLVTQMYQAAAFEMGYRTHGSTIRAIIALLDSARTWCEAPEQEIDALARHAVSLSRGLLLTSKNEGK